MPNSYVVGNPTPPPAPTPPSVGFGIALSGSDIVYSALAYGGTRITIGIIQNSTGNFVRSVISASDAAALGITLDANGKIAVV